MNTTEYQSAKDYIFKICGINLGDSKEYLIEQRLEPLAKEYLCNSLGEFIQLLEERGFDQSLKERVICAVTTNETSFFRDIDPFDVFKNHILPDLMKLAIDRKNSSYIRRGPKVQIWSAASSTGQEAYSLAMLINESLTGEINDLEQEDFLITGTDISSSVLSKAILGIYGEHELARGINNYRRNRHFIKVGNQWEVQSHLKRIVEFRPINLVQNFTYLGSYDLIFCRNVLIYFDNKTKQSILNQIYDMLAPKGYLILGSAESIYGIHDGFESENFGSVILYRRK